ncbi:MAG TPA: aspartate--tRNA ligase [Verrucomicrobiae bacterium]|nr:aspartate--tRNA ligase [Verrucomicrobiae bacterium]
MKRTHHCGELRAAQIGQKVTLTGWVHVRRDLGGIVFIELRDRGGNAQVVFDPQHNKPSWELAQSLRDEFVIAVEGAVRKRPAGTENPKMATGEIEVLTHHLEILNPSETPPFQIDESGGAQAGEDLRLQYRYLDLRRPVMARNLALRHRTAKAVRDYFDAKGFLEVETPILFKSTPEGAREYLVPSRVNPGKFYALPQSPQQFKQMLMVAGVDRYFQIAKCFRDEDLRADRQPEFTQIDVEMSFITREDMYAIIEGLLAAVWRAARGEEIPTPFPRMPFQEAMERFGSDKPDTRFGIELTDFTKDFAQSQFKVFRGAVDAGGVVKALNAKGLASVTQGQIDSLTETAKGFGAKGLAYIKVEGGEWKSPIVKFFSDAEKKALAEKLRIEEGDLILFGADKREVVWEVLGRLRLIVADLLKKQGKLTVPDDQWNFLWVVDFPLITFDREANRYLSTHHPFTAPVAEDVPLLDSEPAKVRGQHYDIVLNGVELGGGSIRIHKPDVQKKVFEDVLKIPADVAQSRFGYMLQAFRYGAPPHGGIALGFDRLCAILCGSSNIRDVIAFPKTAKAVDLMTGSPSEVEPKQLRDLHIKLDVEDGD